MGLCRIQFASFKRCERQQCKTQCRGGSSGKVLGTKQAFVQHKTRARVGGANTKEVTRALSSEASALDAEQHQHGDTATARDGSGSTAGEMPGAGRWRETSREGTIPAVP